MIITGDVTQVDLTVPKSGLATIERILDGIDDIAFAHLKPEDVVRHALVGKTSQRTTGTRPLPATTADTPRAKPHPGKQASKSKGTLNERRGNQRNRLAN